VSSIELAKQEALAAKKTPTSRPIRCFASGMRTGKIHTLTSAELALKGQLLERNREIYRQTVEPRTRNTTSK
jgi:hypothetical protein